MLEPKKGTYNLYTNPLGLPYSSIPDRELFFPSLAQEDIMKHFLQPLPDDSIPVPTSQLAANYRVSAREPWNHFFTAHLGSFCPNTFRPLIFPVKSSRRLDTANEAGLCHSHASTTQLPMHLTSALRSIAEAWYCHARTSAPGFAVAFSAGLALPWRFSMAHGALNIPFLGVAEIL